MQITALLDRIYFKLVDIASKAKTRLPICIYMDHTLIEIGTSQEPPFGSAGFRLVTLHTDKNQLVMEYREITEDGTKAKEPRQVVLIPDLEAYNRFQEALAKAKE